MATGRFCGGDNLLIRSVWTAEFNVILDGIPEQIDILKNHTDIFEQTIAGKSANIRSTNGNRSTIDIVKTGNQVTQRRFSTARWSHDGSCGILRNFEVQVMQNNPAIISEGNIPKLNIIG